MLSPIIGQDKIVDTIHHMLGNDRIPHAVLITGKSGWGTWLLAKHLAAGVLCQNLQSGVPCQSCASCRRVQKMEHPDLHLSFPTIVPKPGVKAHSKHYLAEFKAFQSQQPYGSVTDWLDFINADNKQGNITADECRSIIDQLNIKSFEGGNKVLLMWMPEFLGNEGNILLKMIEEPPAQTFIILVSENPDGILSTIKSRTQSFHLQPIEPALIADYLCENLQLEPQEALQVASLSKGSIGEALSVAKNNYADFIQLIKDMLNAIFTAHPNKILQFSEQLSAWGRVQIRHFIQYFSELVHQTMLLMLLPDGTNLGNVNPICQKLASYKFTMHQLERMHLVLEQSAYHIERNANAKIQITAMLIKLASIVLNKRLTSLDVYKLETAI